MLLAYLFAAVVGLVLLAAALLGGTDAHGAGHALPGTDHTVGDDAGGGSGASTLPALLSLRTWTYLLAFGGLSGIALRYLAGTREPWTALLALCAGALAAAVSNSLFRRVSAQGQAGTVSTPALVGRSASVLVPFEHGATGKVRVQVNDRTVDLLATTDDRALSAREEVLIVEVRDGTTAHVTRNPAGGTSGRGKS